MNRKFRYIFTKINLSTLLPKKLEENNWAAFDGEFETNFILPNFIGIGNGITRGYGTLHGLFDLNEKDLIQSEIGVTNSQLDEKKPTSFTDFQEIDINKVPNSNKVIKRKQSKPKRSKKILNEEFDLEDYESSDNKSARYKNSKRKKNTHRNKTKPKQKQSTGEINYNSEEYHKKQHEF